MLGSKVGMGKTSVDAETNELVRKFSGLEGVFSLASYRRYSPDRFRPAEYTAKLVKDSSSFRDSVASAFILFNA